jgi:hypothetical protein
MNCLRASLFLSLITFVGCSSADPAVEESSLTESALASKRWEPVVRCEDGTVVDVNADERRELQLVVRNPRAIEALQHGIECQWDPAKCPTNARGEIVFRGQVDRGVFAPQDFDKFLGWAVPASPDWLVAGLVDREGDTVKVQIGEYYSWIFRNCR